MAQLVARRASLMRLLFALVVARIVVTIAEAVESRVSWWSLAITLALVIEIWRGRAVLRAGRSAAAAEVPVRDTPWERVLRPFERFGPPALYFLTATFIVAFLGLLVAGEPREDLVELSALVRELLSLIVIIVLVVGYRVAAVEPGRNGGEGGATEGATAR